MSTTTANSPEQMEDILLRRIFLLDSSMANNDSCGELRNLIERIIVNRLSGNSESPFQYLIGVYRRAYDEGNRICISNESIRAQIELVVNQVKKSVVSYCRMYLLGKPDEKIINNGRAKSNVSPLLPLVLNLIDESGGVGSCTSFLDDLFNDPDSEFEDTEPIFKQLYEDLRGVALKCSALANFQQPLKALLYLISFPVGARALVNHPCWIPKGNGRVIEMTSILGPFLRVSAIPDKGIFKGQPDDIGKKCFSNSSTRDPADLLSSFKTIKSVMNNVYDGLTEVFRLLLNNASTRENVLQYIEQVINKNASRAHFQVDPISCASSGMFVNLSAVMLRLLEPFLDANLTNKEKIDPKYILFGPRLDFKDLTALHASSEDIKKWLSKNNPTNTSNGENVLLHSQETSSSTSAVSSQRESTSCSFTCECFFMTARVLNLGLLKVFSNLKQLVQDISRCEDSLSTLKNMQLQSHSPRLVQDIARIENEIDSYTQEKLCYEAQILRDGRLLQQALAFYQSMVVWLVGFLGGFKMPLPQSCPMEFTCMPEHFVEDVLELLIFASQIPRALDGVKLDDFMNFIIMFMASPGYIRNSYLRAKMVEVLNCWIPHRSGTLSVTSSLFEGNQFAIQYLVGNLFKLYVDVEFTGSHIQSDDSFNIRHNILDLLEYLWQIPVYQNAWKQISKDEEKGGYLNFLTFVINDSIFLLNESMNKVSELKTLEAEMSQENFLRVDLKLVTKVVNMLAFSTEQITAPLLLPEMVEKVASMLNYFLLQLVGPHKKLLSLEDPDKCEFQLTMLLKQIVNIYVNLEKGDHESIFPYAIIKEEQFYNEQLFTEASNILKRFGEDPRIIQAFDDLGQKVKAAASEIINGEATLGDISDEFLDPIQCAKEKDPVILPSSRMIVDQPMVQRQLPTDTTMIIKKKYRCIHSATCMCTNGHLSEDVIFLLLQNLNWNPKIIATLSCVCKWFDDLVKRVLWKEFCRTRAPKMMHDLQSSGSHSVDGNWSALGKLLIYCSGCKKDGLFNKIQIPGHFAYRTRFSRTSGKSFLLPNCRTDVLYVSDPCEHLDQGEEGDVGFFRGVFKSFTTSKVRKMLVRRGAKFHPTEFCPYCKGKLWSMLQAKMIPQSASCRLGAYEDCIEYYVCLNGHVLGVCTLLPLSDSEEVSELG
ncbi:probable ubiquitin conjugation factor E4 [Rutidosis leptorrhynchoides]|uniref:probable ubiquitin conjugation factor E4 n=1 Tax=Rutidosis leptorrhynchoides TaxID=125765 RepID=UPI003A98D669